MLPFGHRSLATAKLGCYTKHCGGLCEMALLVLGIAKNVHNTPTRQGLVHKKFTLEPPKNRKVAVMPLFCREEVTRTPDLCVPNAAR